MYANISADKILEDLRTIQDPEIREKGLMISKCYSKQTCPLRSFIPRICLRYTKNLRNVSLANLPHRLNVLIMSKNGISKPIKFGKYSLINLQNNATNKTRTKTTGPATNPNQRPPRSRQWVAEADRNHHHRTDRRTPFTHHNSTAMGSERPDRKMNM